jgi:hypothetical protein
MGGCRIVERVSGSVGEAAREGPTTKLPGFGGEAYRQVALPEVCEKAKQSKLQRREIQRTEDEDSPLCAVREE